jgi:uncharacterized cysteine cluster protein YcgN (CxxCxxCC family)
VDPSELAAKEFDEVFAALMEKLCERDGPSLCCLRRLALADEIEGVSCRVRCNSEECRRRLILRRERGSWYVGNLLTSVQPVAWAND